MQMFGLDKHRKAVGGPRSALVAEVAPWLHVADEAYAQLDMSITVFMHLNWPPHPDMGPGNFQSLPGDFIEKLFEQLAEVKGCALGTQFVQPG